MKNAASFLLNISLLAGCASAPATQPGEFREYTSSFQIVSDEPLPVFEQLADLAQTISFDVDKTSIFEKFATLIQRKPPADADGIENQRGLITIEGITTKILRIRITIEGNFKYGKSETTQLLFEKIHTFFVPSSPAQETPKKN